MTILRIYLLKLFFSCLVFLTVYIILLYTTVMWFMDLEAPNFEQSGLISVVVGAGAAWFGLYAGTSGASKSFKGEDK